MANDVYVTYVLEDSYGKRVSRRFQAKSAGVTDGQVQALGANLAALTQLGLIEAMVTKPVSITATSAVAESTRSAGAAVRYRKSSSSPSNGGVWTLKIPQPVAALVNADGGLDIANAVFNNFAENFDDGLGLLAVAGDFYISHGEELMEATASDNAVISGELDKS